MAEVECIQELEIDLIGYHDNWNVLHEYLENMVL